MDQEFRDLVTRCRKLPEDAITQGLEGNFTIFTRKDRVAADPSRGVNSNQTRKWPTRPTRVNSPPPLERSRGLSDRSPFRAGTHANQYPDGSHDRDNRPSAIRYPRMDASRSRDRVNGPPSRFSVGDP